MVTVAAFQIGLLRNILLLIYFPVTVSHEVRYFLPCSCSSHFKMCFVCVSLNSHSDVASGMSDGNEGVTGGRHEGRSAKRHQRRSVRSRSRHDKITKAKLNVLNVRLLHTILGFFCFLNLIRLNCTSDVCLLDL